MALRSRNTLVEYEIARRDAEIKARNEQKELAKEILVAVCGNSLELSYETADAYATFALECSRIFFEKLNNNTK